MEKPKWFRRQPPFKPSAAVRAEPVNDVEDFDVFRHECHELAAKLLFPVVATWKGEEYLFTHYERCPCSRCDDRNPGLQAAGNKPR